MTRKMTLHLLVNVMGALGSGQTGFFFWHPSCRVLVHVSVAFGISVQVLGEQTALSHSFDVADKVLC